MKTEADFFLDDNEGRQASRGEHHSITDMLPPGLQTAVRVVNALITMATGAATPANAMVRAGAAEDAASSEQEWVQWLRQSSSLDVRAHFTRLFSEFQIQALQEAQNATGSRLYYEAKLQLLAPERERLNALVNLAATADDESAGKHYINKLEDVEEDMAHFRSLAADAEGRKKRAHQNQEIAHLQLRAIKHALDRWTELRAGADAARVQQSLCLLRGRMQGAIERLTEGAIQDMTTSQGVVEVANLGSTYDLRSRSRLIAEKWQLRRRSSI